MNNGSNGITKEDVLKAIADNFANNRNTSRTFNKELYVKLNTEIKNKIISEEPRRVSR